MSVLSRLSRSSLLVCILASSLVVTACNRNADEGEPADAHTADALGDDAPAVSEAAETESAALTAPSFEPKMVETIEGVRTIDALPLKGDLEATWTTCSAALGVHLGGSDQRAPVHRLLWNDGVVYLVAQGSENELLIEAYGLHLDEESCALRPFTEFGDDGRMNLGGGAVDVDFFGDLLVVTGIKTRVFTRLGEQRELCEHLPRLTRLRGAGAHGGARRTGTEIVRATIDEDTCTTSALPAIGGEELLGMQLALLSPDALFATLHYENVPNALGFFENGALVWRYFPAETTAETRTTLITGMSVLGEDALVVRSLPQRIDVVTREGELRASFDGGGERGQPLRDYPYSAVEIAPNTALVAFRTHEASADHAGVELRVLRTQEITPEP